MINLILSTFCEDWRYDQSSPLEDLSGLYGNIMSSPQGFNRKEVLHRIGTFFIILGIGLLVFFLLSEAARQVQFEYFCWSTLLLVIGFMFRGQFKRSVPPSGRFSIVKRLIPKSKKEAQGKK